MSVRELYFQNMILHVGSMLNEDLQIIDRRTNHVVCQNRSGDMVSYLIDEAYELQKAHSSYSKKSIFDVVDAFPKDSIPEKLLEALKPSLSASADKYNSLAILKGVQALALDKGTAGIFEDVSKRIQKIDSKIQLEDFFTKPAKEEIKIQSSILEDIKSKTQVASTGPKRLLSVLYESLDEFKKKLNSLKPADVDHLVDQVNDLEDIADHYDTDELVHHVDEHLSREGRIKRKIEFKKTEAKREHAREISLKRVSSPQKLIGKSRKAAIALIKEKLAHKSLDKLSIEEKDRLEDMIAKRKDLVDRLARKLAPKIKEIERNRVYHHGNKLNEGVNRTADADDIEDVEVVDGEEVIRRHPAGAVFSDGGMASDKEVSV